MGSLDGLKERQRAAALGAIRVWANHVLGEAQRLAPVEEGSLRAAGEMEVFETDAGASIVISFSTAYAARQHEELSYRHPKGGQAKYLETPFKANVNRLEPLVSAAVRAAT